MSRKNSPAPATSDPVEALKPSDVAEADDDGASVASLSDLPPPLISEDDYDSLVCRECVSKIVPVRRYAGTDGAMIVVRETGEGPWVILGKDSRGEAEVSADEEPQARSPEGLPSTSGSNKRSFEGEMQAFPEENRLKRPRMSDHENSDDDDATSCTAPPASEKIQGILDKVFAKEPDYTLGAGDVFLTEGWRTRWCQCAKVDTITVF